MRLRFLWPALLMLLPRVALAQTPTPVTAASGFTFTSPDHTTLNADGTPVIARYEIRFTPGAGCAALAPFNGAKPAPDAQGNILIKPVAPLGTLTGNCAYTAVVAAIGPTGLEMASDPTDPFQRVVPKVPAKPSKPAVSP
jgi:hypothetical protein